MLTLQASSGTAARQALQTPPTHSCLYCIRACPAININNRHYPRALGLNL